MNKGDKEQAESMRKQAKILLTLANEIDPPYPCGPFEEGFVCVGGGSWDGCQEACTDYLKWKAKQEEEKCTED